MVVQQLSVFLENKPGVLAEFCATLAAENVNIQGISITDSVDHAVVRLVVDDPVKALHILGERQTLALETEVLAVNLTDAPGTDRYPGYSPDGSQILYVSDRDGNEEIYVMQAGGGGQTNLTNHPAEDEYPSWSSDGSLIAFHSDRQYGLEVFIMNADGSQQTAVTQMAPAGYPRFRP